MRLTPAYTVLALGLVLCLPATLSAQPPGGRGLPPGGGTSDHDIGNLSTAVAKDALALNTTGSNNTATVGRTDH